MNRQRIFSGIQPSGNLHLGNYLGAIKNWVKLQDEYDSIFCVVDLHAITVPQNPEELRKKTLEVAKIYLAAGIDPEKCSIFIQSHVSEHTELMWILNTITKIPELNKMTQFKDKSVSSDVSNISIGAGLLNYPVLMAADILLYDTNLVPVGEDQLQHIEITRTLAKRFNKRFGETFVIPEPYIQKEGMRIMGLDDPTKKMSKSASSEYNYIALTDDEETIRKKIKKAVTDSGSEIVYCDDKPALKNLINIYSLLSDTPPKEIEKKYENKGYADFKSDLADVAVSFMKPFQKKMKEYDDEKVLEILRQGAERVRPLAKKKLEEVKKKIGFVI
ncbi:MAG: tryptophanyl-tRNA synthetase [Patescibacteria group bacterium]|nr:tryptophanyl-tRNA synthetase [Patescibacteria group bacterium]